MVQTIASTLAFFPICARLHIVTHRDLKRIIEETFVTQSAELREILNSVDIDCDKELEYNDFLSAMLAGRVQLHDDVLQKAFSKFDQDGSGIISKHELQSVLGDSFAECEVEDMIRQADTSGDGEIDYGEFIAYFYRQEAGDEISRPSIRKRKTEKLGVIIDQLLDVVEKSFVDDKPTPTRKTLAVDDMMRPRSRTSIAENLSPPY